MPMPPPRPSAQRRQDRRTRAELAQLTRALRASGPTTPEELENLVDAQFWDAGRFTHAVALGVSEGYLIRAEDGTLSTPRR